MKIVFITGSHPRHKFIARSVAQTGYLSAIISEDRGEFIPEPPQRLKDELRALFRRHFVGRGAAEERHFGDAHWPDTPVHSISAEALNSKTTHDILREHQPDLLLTYGCHKLDDETLDLVKGERWNIHGGLSPWYKGAITHFWPSYMLEPQMTGMTVHDLTNQLDAGDVVHQCAADMVRGDGLHDVACRAVFKLGQELPILVRCLADGNAIIKKKHKTSGKLWPSSHWRPEHLKLIYQVYNDRMVDSYLDGDLEQKEPRLHRQF